MRSLTENIEVWKKVPEFSDYSVSNLGHVRRDTPSRSRPRGGHHLKPRAGTKGHMYVNLRKNNRAYSQYVHRIVLFTFVGKPPAGKPCAGHRNGDPSDNRLTNIRWVSHKENSQDSIKHGTSGRPGGTRHFHAKLTVPIINDCRKRFEGGESLRSIARSLGVTHKCIGNAVHGRSYRHETSE